jgi:hypothetical protein
VPLSRIIGGHRGGDQILASARRTGRKVSAFMASTEPSGLVGSKSMSFVHRFGSGPCQRQCPENVWSRTAPPRFLTDYCQSPHKPLLQPNLESAAVDVDTAAIAVMNPTTATCRLPAVLARGALKA